MVVTFQGRHQVFIAVESQAADDGEADIGVHGVDEVAVRVGVKVVDDHQIRCRSRRDGADILLPVGSSCRP